MIEGDNRRDPQVAALGSGPKLGPPSGVPGLRGFPIERRKCLRSYFGGMNNIGRQKSFWGRGFCAGSLPGPPCLLRFEKPRSLKSKLVRLNLAWGRGAVSSDPFQSLKSDRGEISPGSEET